MPFFRLLLSARCFDFGRFRLQSLHRAMLEEGVEGGEKGWPLAFECPCLRAQPGMRTTLWLIGEVDNVRWEQDRTMRTEAEFRVCKLILRWECPEDRQSEDILSFGRQCLLPPW